MLSPEMALGAYNAWARADILAAWTFETDPANFQPKVRRLNREVAAYLREYPPLGIEQERLHRCLDAVESPWSRREENLLRLAWEWGFPSFAEKSRHLVEEVERIGAEPFRAPDPLPPIGPDEKEDLIHELDAVVAHLYGLTEQHLRYVFETFHEGWGYAARLEATLLHYRAWRSRL